MKFTTNLFNEKIVALTAEHLVGEIRHRIDQQTSQSCFTFIRATGSQIVGIDAADFSRVCQDR